MTQSNTPEVTQPPDLISVGTKALVAHAKPLGLVWTRLIGTVLDGTDPAQVQVFCDADTVATTAASMIGPLPIGTRVYVDLVPPGAAFIVGFADGVSPQYMGLVNVNQAAAAGTTTSATYVDMPGAPTATLTKAFPTTRIRVDLHTSLLSTLTNTAVRVAVSIAGTDVDIANFTINPASTHMVVSGTKIATSSLTGSVAIVGRWRRSAGGGTLTQATDDWISFTCAEVV